jgi:hypothetical protein
MRPCLKQGCPWQCGTRRIPACAERLVAYVLGAALVVGLVATVAVGLTSISGNFEPSHFETITTPVSTE